MTNDTPTPAQARAVRRKRKKHKLTHAEVLKIFDVTSLTNLPPAIRNKFPKAVESIAGAPRVFNTEEIVSLFCASYPNFHIDAYIDNAAPIGASGRTGYRPSELDDLRRTATTMSLSSICKLFTVLKLHELPVRLPEGVRINDSMTYPKAAVFALYDEWVANGSPPDPWRADPWEAAERQRDEEERRRYG